MNKQAVQNLGWLPYWIEEEEFISGFSVPRNKEIMRVFHYLEIVEHLGSGVPRIPKACGKKAFEIRYSYVRIVFRYAKPLSETGQVTGQVTGAFPRSQCECSLGRSSVLW